MEEKNLSINILDDRKKITNEFLKSIDIVKTTRDTYRKAINKWLDYLEEKEIKEPNFETMKNFKDEILANCTPTYCNSVMTAIKRLYKYLNKHYHIVDLCEEIKNERVDLKHKRRGLNVEQAKQLLYVSKKDLRGEALIRTSLILGARTIELERANISDIKCEGGKNYIYLWRKGHKKADTKMFLPNDLYELLEKYIREERSKFCNDANEGKVPLFITQDRNPKFRGARLRTRAIREIITNRMDKVIKNRRQEKISSHSLRRTAIGEVVRRDGITLGMQFATHSSTKVTQIYLDEEIEMEQKERAINTLNSLYV